MMQISVAGPVLFHVYDSTGHHTGMISDTSWEAGIVGSEFIAENIFDPESFKTVILPSGESYRFRMESQDTVSSFSVAMCTARADSVGNVVLYDDLPLKRRTIATGTLSTVSPKTGILLDYDGNGVIDSVALPKDLGEGTTSVGRRAIPTDFALSQSYPNPFNPSTTIKFELPKASHVSLSIYDMLGREVAVLVNERRDAGIHEVRFDGSRLASGVYLYRIQAGTFVQTRKLLLLK